MSDPDKAAGQTNSRRWWRRGVLAVAVGAIVAAAFAYAGWLPLGVDAVRSSFRGLKRQISVSLGYPLPGTPDLSRFQERLNERGLTLGSPVFVRIFKQEYELELWMKQGSRFAHFATYPICNYSGGLGPKLRQGDRQSPEGFYTVGRSQLNPNSRWRRSFNLGFPNLLDASHGRTGGLLMVHGGCASIGCYAMTNAVIDEVWALINAAFDGGQPQFAVHVFPFRMSDWRMSAYKDAKWAVFWEDLKRGYDLFEQTRIPPVISVCNKRYIVSGGDAGSHGESELRAACPRGHETAGRG